MTTVLQAARTLLSVCDGAVSRDGEGFNKFDSRFVRSILEKGRDLTQRQELVIHKLLRKYKVQLIKHRIEYDSLELVAQNQAKPSQTLAPQAMILDYIPDPRLPLFKLHSRIDFAKIAKSFPSSYWHPEDKTWTYSPTIEFFTAIQPYIKDGSIEDTPSAQLILIDLAKAKKRLQMVNEIKGSSPISDNTMPTMMKPFSHQIKAFQVGTTVDQAGLLMEQGTGKTLSAICIAGHRYLKGQIKRLLIVAPLSVTSVWKEEFAKVASFPYELHTPVEIRKNDVIRFEPNRLHIMVINYESTWRMIDRILKWKPEMIIADESQKIKNGRAKQSKALIQIGDQAKYKLILSGTPITQGPLDVWSQYRFLNHNIFGKRFLKFRDRYARMGGYGGYKVLGYENLEELAKKAHSIAYRVTKAEALDLPPQIDQTVKVQLEPEAEKLYKRMEKDFIIKFSEDKTVTAPIILTQLLRLQQMTGGFIPLDESDEIKQISSAKVQMVEELLDDLPHNKKVVIFCRFIPEIEAIAEIAEKLGRKYRTLTGKTKDRAEARLAFQEDPQVTVMIAQIQTGGLGITLTSADTVIFYSTTFSFADYDQAKSRVHRIGQSSKVTYIHILADNTVDEDILNILRSKGDMAKLIVDTLARKFSSKPFTSGAESDIFNLKVNSKEDSSMTDSETKVTTTPEAGQDKAANLKDKLQKIKQKSETKTPTAKKTAEEPVVKKNKVKEEKAKKPQKPAKKEKAEKGEKKVAKTANPKLVLLKDIAAEFGLDPREVRKTLRKEFKREEGSSWAWEKGSAELTEIKASLRKMAKSKK